MLDVNTPEIELRLTVRNHRLFQARKERQLSRQNLALLTGISLSRIILAETARTILKVSEQQELADALGYGVTWLFSEELGDAINEGVFDERVKLTSPSMLAMRGPMPPMLPGARQKELQVIISNALRRLNDQQRFVLIHRFGLFDEPQKTLEETGKLMGITKERVRQIEVRALRMSRNPSLRRSIGLTRDLIDER